MVSSAAHQTGNQQNQTRDSKSLQIHDVGNRKLYSGTKYIHVRMMGKKLSFSCRTNTICDPGGSRNQSSGSSPGFDQTTEVTVVIVTVRA